MKRVGIIALATLLIVAFTIPVAALENKFGGYWRTRFDTSQNFTGNDNDNDESENGSSVDTRTRLYYTAILNDDLKLVNNFEMDAVWGDKQYGDIGADGVKLEIKNSYADFNVGPVNAKVGVQGMTLARGFLFADDFAGAVVTYKLDDSISLPLFWVKAYEGGDDNNIQDVDYFGISPIIKMDGISVNPFILYAGSDDVSGWKSEIGALDAVNNLDLYYIGVDASINIDPAKIWFTGIYQGGEIEYNNGTKWDTGDVNAFLVAAGASAGLGNIEAHGQTFYACGDETKSNKYDPGFFVLQGDSYYWSEIMGLGTFDTNSLSHGETNDHISNIIAINGGGKVTIDENLSAGLDIWYAMLAEDVKINGKDENELGLEVDVKVTYQIVEGLKVDLIGAYLFAGDVVTNGAKDEADPYELGTRLSLSF